MITQKKFLENEFLRLDKGCEGFLVFILSFLNLPELIPISHSPFTFTIRS